MGSQLGLEFSNLSCHDPCRWGCPQKPVNDQGERGPLVAGRLDFKWHTVVGGSDSGAWQQKQRVAAKVLQPPFKLLVAPCGGRGPQLENP